MSFGAVVMLIAAYEKWGSLLAHLFHGGSIGRPGGGYGTNGGRVLTVVGRGADLAAARAAAERAADRISWDGLQRRHDIAASLPPEPALAAGAAS
jgi:phosphoribosylamine-glycine ligase